MNWTQLLAFGMRGRGKLLYGAALACLVVLWGMNTFAQPKQQEQTNSHETTRQYIEYYEQRLEETLSQIQGVGKAQVMLTLDSGVERVYATDRERSGSTTADRQESSDRQSTVVISAGGSQQPILEQEREPKIKGVMVVCQGGDSEAVRLEVIQGVRTLLDVPSSRIAVSKSK